MEKKRSASFGEYLKTVRLEKGIKLSSISSQTRIHMDTLAALEDEDHARLPAEVFVKGFIRAYARAVGADGDIAVKGYVESRRFLVETVRFKADETGTRSRPSARLLVFLGFFAVMAVIAVFMLRTAKPLKTGEPVITPRPPETAVVKKAPPVVKETPAPVTPVAPSEPAVPAAASVPTETTVAEPQKPPEAAPPETVAPLARQHIRIQVVEETWLKVIVDSLSTNEYSLAPGDTLELEADKGFNLLIGNATGIQLTFNDTPVPVPGKSGQVVTIQLP